MNPMNLSGRVIIITGAAQGIGQGVARKAASLGATLALVDLNGDGVKATAAELGAAHSVHVGSVADPGFVQQMVADVVARHGDVNGLFNNAGMGARVEDVSRKRPTVEILAPAAADA